MPKQRRDVHGFFRPDNTNNLLLIAHSTLLPQAVAEARQTPERLNKTIGLGTPLVFLRKCSFQTSLGRQLLQGFIPEAARVLVLEAAECGIRQAANFALEFFFAARKWVGRSGARP